MKLSDVAAAALMALALTTASHAADNSPPHLTTDSTVTAECHVETYPPLDGGKSVSNPAGHYVFQDTGARGVNPKTGIKASNVWGDMKTGAHGAFFRFDPGFVIRIPMITTRSSLKATWRITNRGRSL